ncbi:TOM7 family-domain-containing protein [Scleroderma citrinum]
MPSEETKERITKVVDVARTVLHYGWIPLIIYIGYTRSSPQPTLIKCVSSVVTQLPVLTLLADL